MISVSAFYKADTFFYPKLTAKGETAMEKIIYIAAIAERTKLFAAAIAISGSRTYKWRNSWHPSETKYRNAKQKTVYAECFALEQMKMLLVKERMHPEEFEVYFYSLRYAYKDNVPNPQLLQETMQIARTF